MNSSEFVLDEGLDDDEDVLAFHSQRQRNGGGYETVESASPANPADTSAPSTSPPPSDTVIIDGMPLSASRGDLNVFLAHIGDKIISLQLRRLEANGILRVRVRFDTTEAAAAALQRDGAIFAGSDQVVSVKPASPERWDDGCGAVDTKATTGGTAAAPPDSLMQKLPDASAVQSGFWSAFGAARAAAERLEIQAKRLGEELEGRLQVSEKVAETREALVEADKKLHVSERVGEMAAAGKAAAQDVDQTYGITKQVGKIVSEVGSAARIVAGEVDENLHLSDKAREATNVALKHEAIGPAVRSVVDSLGTKRSEACRQARC